jgi:hypothetical protein
MTLRDPKHRLVAEKISDSPEQWAATHIITKLKLVSTAIGGGLYETKAYDTDGTEIKKIKNNHANMLRAICRAKAAADPNWSPGLCLCGNPGFKVSLGNIPVCRRCDEIETHHFAGTGKATERTRKPNRFMHEFGDFPEAYAVSNR